jgi:hypothetical protein
VKLEAVLVAPTLQLVRPRMTPGGTWNGALGASQRGATAKHRARRTGTVDRPSLIA